MKRKSISFEVEIYPDVTALSEQERQLMESAIEAREKAYAPYSKFRVGASALLDNGQVVQGNNQENAAYPAGLCAERVAVFYAGANYPGQSIEMIAITAASNEIDVNKPAAPCGNCRQSLSEYEFKQKKPIVLLLMGEKGEVYKCGAISDILPLGFNNSYLP